MIDTIDFDISIRDNVERIRIETNNHHINAKTFASGYIWGGPMGIKIHIEDDMFAMKNNCHGSNVWNFPVGGERPKMAFVNELVSIEGLKLRLLTEDDVAFLDEHYHDMFMFEEAVDESEYIYDSVEHAEMTGKRFASLRRMMNKFNREHDIKTIALTSKNMQTAEEIMMSWGNAHEERGELDTTGMEIDRFLLDHYDELGMIGILVYIDGVPSAVVIGYPLSSDMCDVAEIKFEPTIEHLGYVAMEEFMKAFGNTYRYFNNEEDMGISGLREYKQCLKPCRMNVLWNACLKGEGS